MTILTTDNISDFINKEVSIICKQWEGNEDVQGTAKIIAYNVGERNPLKVEGITGEGNFLQNAIINEDGEFCIGDTDRPILICDVSKLSIREQIGVTLADLRIKQGITIRKMAQLANTNTRAVQAVEKGWYNVGIDTYIAIAEALKAKIEISG